MGNNAAKKAKRDYEEAAEIVKDMPKDLVNIVKEYTCDEKALGLEEYANMIIELMHHGLEPQRAWLLLFFECYNGIPIDHEEIQRVKKRDDPCLTYETAMKYSNIQALAFHSNAMRKFFPLEKI